VINGIVAAAVRFNGLTISMPAPARHSDILRRLYDIDPSAAIECQQGFIDRDGDFLDRESAKTLVAVTGQQTIRATHATQLFSEDLW